MATQLKSKHQRLVLVLLAVAALIGAALLAMSALRDKAAFFLTPSDFAAGKAETGQAARLGGMVVKGSLKRGADGVSISFMVSDGKAQVPAKFTGIVPDLFRVGRGGRGALWSRWHLPGRQPPCEARRTVHAPGTGRHDL